MDYFNQITDEYKVVLAKFPVSNGTLDRWIITKNSLPMFEVNQWIDLMSINSIATGKRYAYAMIGYFTYLDKIGRHYRDVIEANVIHGFLHHLLYNSEDNNIKFIQPQKSLKTISNNLSIIISFYQWLDENSSDFYMSSLKLSKTKNKKINTKISKSFLYGQIWDSDLRNRIRNKYGFKQKRNYRKWYTEEEKQALISNFLTLRDKSIFLISLEGGCRIDEILNITYNHYNSFERTIYIKVSKTFDRTIILPRYVCDEIDRYILTERQQAEMDVGLVNWLFINLRNNASKGEKVKYRNYYEILKRCAKRAGLNPSEIITHAGRATKAQELIEHQVLHPEDGITDTLIMEMMGWTRIDSIIPYKKQFSAKISKVAADKVFERKRKNKCNSSDWKARQ